MAALFIIAKKWKQPKCPSMDEWINKMWYIHTIEYYSAIKGIKYDRCYNVDEPQKLMLNERNQKCCVLYDSIYMKYPE